MLSGLLIMSLAAAGQPELMANSKSKISAVSFGSEKSSDVFGTIDLPLTQFAIEQCGACNCSPDQDSIRFVLLSSNYSKESVARESLEAFLSETEATVAAVGCFENQPIIRRVFSR
ncbi:hypothetical protein [Pseudobacteriovorax antillogorgiicola]|uniref:Uncharacterized protein n=1 Tax=Pseudobacteriovorax antillogorgiicola TaxID=1513793 RepID=A0A1Y6C801_9BACT|nr:hypothetical protein [Pseudobacteriovorax antillogorgiicola]TCS50791.1 hypothetical protein EDD56_112174 [Pseudobacteriovorax antillogorgiicola]SMF41551.1 hypothetical protein SAMN06296036_112173 [Pseudobacteriovorax antillogorgiicola]